jgi:50S ribosomal protein L16 3-hydroxylase
MHRVADEIEDETLYTDRAQAATAQPGEIPPALNDFAVAAMTKALADPTLMQQILGEYLTEPKQNVWFDAGKAPKKYQALRLDRRSRMMYDAKHVYLNGDSWKVAGKDAKLLRKLADARALTAADLVAVSPALTTAFGQFIEQGWLHADG